MVDTEILEDVRALWTAVFGREVGDDEDFFAIGGDSLSAVNIVLTLQKQRRVSLDLETFFLAPTIAGLAKYCAACEAAAPAADRAVEPS